ncbi:CHASE domain-containing sensor histidine kinase [Kangiella marina]|uniref:histidine kinase n=1 Tax=Kangiella marina TaxID=1079178 RepID=A0ABP8IAZ9_9GAMM
MTEKHSALTARHQLQSSGKLQYIHWIVIFFSLILTIVAWYYSNKSILIKHEARFERYSEQAISQVIERMEIYKNALEGGIAFIVANDNKIDIEQWSIYTQRLDITTSHPGINGLGVIYNLKPEELDDFIAIQRQKRPDFKVFPEHNNPEHWPIALIEPLEINQQALGLDVAFEQNRYDAITKAKETASAQITGPIQLVQDSEKTPGFLFYVPFYEQSIQTANKNHGNNSIKGNVGSIIGVVYAPFIMKNLMNGTLSQEKRQINLKIKDGGEMIFDEKNAVEQEHTPIFEKNVQIPMYGRTWDFYLESSTEFEQAVDYTQSRFILIGGLLINLMLILLFYSITKFSRKALSYADNMTEILEQETKELEKLNHDLEQFTYVASHDLKSPLNAIKQLSSWVIEDCYDLLPDESKRHLNLLQQRSIRMEKLLTDLLDYSRLHKIVNSNDSVNLKDLTESIVFLQDIPQAFKVKGQDINVNFPKEPLEIMLRNLISNSVKHHHQTSGVITVSYSKTTSDNVIKVTDDGPGIDKEYHHKVLEMFQTLKPRDEVEGSGMGLAIVKRIMENFGGSVEIESDGENGTTMLLIWPISKTDK